MTTTNETNALALAAATDDAARPYRPSAHDDAVRACDAATVVVETYVAHFTENADDKVAAVAALARDLTDADSFAHADGDPFALAAYVAALAVYGCDALDDDHADGGDVTLAVIGAMREGVEIDDRADALARVRDAIDDRRRATYPWTDDADALHVVNALADRYGVESVNGNADDDAGGVQYVNVGDVETPSLCYVADHGFGVASPVALADGFAAVAALDARAEFVAALDGDADGENVRRCDFGNVAGDGVVVVALHDDYDAPYRGDGRDALAVAVYLDGVAVLALRDFRPPTCWASDSDSVMRDAIGFATSVGDLTPSADTVGDAATYWAETVSCDTLALWTDDDAGEKLPDTVAFYAADAGVYGDGVRGDAGVNAIVADTLDALADRVRDGDDVRENDDADADRLDALAAELRKGGEWSHEIADDALAALNVYADAGVYFEFRDGDFVLAIADTETGDLFA